MGWHGSAATGYTYANNQASFQADPSGLDPSAEWKSRAYEHPPPSYAHLSSLPSDVDLP